MQAVPIHNPARRDEPDFCYADRGANVSIRSRHPEVRARGVLMNMLDEFLNQRVVVDLSSPYVCLGKLTRYDDNFLEMKNADLHDLRDTETSRENYVAASVATGIKRNRKRVLLRRQEIVAISILEDVVDE
jgi:small nuclear ribonucleoprotein (snRNP)-like protein